MWHYAHSKHNLALPRLDCVAKSYRLALFPLPLKVVWVYAPFSVSVVRSLSSLLQSADKFLEVLVEFADTMPTVLGIAVIVEATLYEVVTLNLLLSP